jgi:hypothetical protein
MRKFFGLLLLIVIFASHLEALSFVQQNPQQQQQLSRYLHLKKRGGGGPLSLPNGWRIVQDNIQTACGSGVSSCSFAACTGSAGAECFAPTTAGSLWIVTALSGSSNLISSVTGGSATWNLCPSSECAGGNSTVGVWQDMAYALNGATSTQTLTVNLTSNSVGFFDVIFAEALPPTGYTASFDTAGNANSTTCTTSCTGVGLTLSSTDFVYQCCGFSVNNNPNNGGKPWSSPYLTAPGTGNALGFNVTSGTAPTVTTEITGFPGAVFSAIAFKSSAGPFTFTGSTNMSLVQYILPTNNGSGTAGQVSCSPGCSALTAFASTGSGNLLFLVEGDTGASGFRLSSITDNKSQTWTIPTGANTCGANAGLSCAYVLSSTSGVTSITPTLTGTTTHAGFSLWEFHRTTGTWTLDVQGAKSQSSTISPVSPTVTCTGTNDTVISAIAASGGVSGMTYAMLGYFPGAALNLQTGQPFDPSNGALINTTNCGPFTFPFEGGNTLSSNTFTVAFQ